MYRQSVLRRQSYHEMLPILFAHRNAIGVKHMGNAQTVSPFFSLQAYAGRVCLTYTLTAADGRYGLYARADGSVEEDTFVEDIAGDLREAKRLQALLAEHLVFPANVSELLSDLLGAVSWL